jgi:hypothetical protein
MSYPVWVSNSIVNPYLFRDLYGGCACLRAYETATVVFTATFPLIRVWAYMVGALDQSFGCLLIDAGNRYEKRGG